MATIRRFGLAIQTESITGYWVDIQYRNGMVYESRCGVGKGCFSVHDEPYEATEDEWEVIIERNRQYIENLKKKCPKSTFKFMVG